MSNDINDSTVQRFRQYTIYGSHTYHNSSISYGMYFNGVASAVHSRLFSSTDTISQAIYEWNTFISIIFAAVVDPELGMPGSC